MTNHGPLPSSVARPQEERQIAVEAALSADLEGVARVVEWRRSIFTTSHPLDELTVDVEGQRHLLAHKDLDGLIDKANGTKPPFLSDPSREPLTYARILSRADLGTARLHAVDVGHRWMVIERIDGVELWQVGDPDVWIRAASWFGRLHATVEVARASSDVPLVRFDGELARTWLYRARHLVGGRLEEVAAIYDDVLDVLDTLPVTFLHGEAYPSNVFVRRDGRICAIDWEMAGIGPCVLDIAALITGLPPQVREAMLESYRTASATGLDAGELEVGVRAASLVQCVQWLGWAESWTPPDEHARDWLAEAQEHLKDLRPWL